MTPIDLGSYKSIYLETAKENIDSMFVSLAKLIENLQDKEAINSLHIASHSLKSKSQVMGHEDIANICLSIEKISDSALKRIVQLNNESVLDIKKQVAELDGILKQVQGNSL